MNNVKFFKNIIANSILGIVVITVFIVAFIDSSVRASVEMPIYRGKSLQSVSIMIKLYEKTDNVDGILDVLNASDVKASFFVSGVWASENVETLQKIHNSGHELGNLGYFYKDHKKLSSERNQEDILVTHKLIKSLIGYEMKLFSPPFGSFSNETILSAKDIGYSTVIWSIDSIQDNKNDENSIFQKSTNKIAGGEIILIHPSNATVAVLDNIIKNIKMNDFDIIPIGTVII